MKAEQIQLNHEWIIVKPDVLKTFKHIEYQPILPELQPGEMNVVKDEEESKEVEEIEIEEIERTIAYVVQQGKVIAQGLGDSLWNVGDKVFIRNNTGMEFQWLGVPSKGTSPKLLKKHEIIGKVI